MEFEIQEIVDANIDKYPYIENYTLLETRKISQKEILCIYVLAETFKNKVKDINGQINLNSELGKLLFYLMCSEDGPKLWLEVGAWNGKGTTTCILEGLLEREKKEGIFFLSYEASTLFYKIANENLEKYKELDSHFKLVNAKLPSTLPFPEAEFIPEKNDHYKYHYDEEKFLYENISAYTPLFEPEVVVLDGGEYVGYQDWEAIPKRNLKHIFLDDCNIYKNKCVHELLKHLSDWECVIYKPDDRNGWSYWRKRVLSA